MNVPTLFGWMTIVSCGAIGGLGSIESGAPWWLSIIFAILGLGIGIWGALVILKTADFFLNISLKKRGFGAILCDIGYMLTPVVGFALSFPMTMILTLQITRILGFEADVN